MITDCDRTEALLALLESTAGLLRMVCMDPTMSPSVRLALSLRADEIEAAVRTGEDET